MTAFRIRILLFLSYSFGIETKTTFIHFRSSLKNHTRFQTKMGKVYIRFQTKTTQKPYPMGRHLCSLYKGVPPPPRITPCTNMDPDECVIFAYDGVPAYRDPVISSPYVQSLCLTPSPPPPLLPPSIPLNIVKQGYCIKPSERYNQGRNLTSGNSKTFG